MDRRHAAILAADIVGFSGIMACDETAAFESLQLAWKAVLAPAVAESGGRVFKRTGDGFLAEFAAPLEAATAALKIQQDMQTGTNGESEDLPLRFRIGVDFGDVIVDGDDLLGNCVNVAVRLEGLAPPGGICVSAAAQELLSGYLQAPLSYVGPQRVKNLPEPVEVWRVEVDGGLSGMGIGLGFALPELPSIAVSPFASVSSEAADEHLAVGLTEDVTSALSRFNSLFVVGRGSALALQSGGAAARDVARALGVQYALEGSIRRAGDRLRISVRLLDAVNDRLVWSERFDCDAVNAFEIQDEITSAVAMAVQPEIQAAEVTRLRRSTTSQPQEWDGIAHAWSEMNAFSATGHAAAARHLEEVIARHPSSAQAHAVLSLCRAMEGLYAWNRPPPQSIRMSAEAAMKGFALEPRNDVALFGIGVATFFQRRHREAEQRFRTVLDINPNSSSAMVLLGSVLAWLREDKESVELLDRAIRLSPRDHWASHGWCHLALPDFRSGDFDTAIDKCERGLALNPRNPSLLRMAAACRGFRGGVEDARDTLRRLFELLPSSSIVTTRAGLPVAFDEDGERFCEGLKRAGMPEHSPADNL